MKKESFLFNVSIHLYIFLISFFFLFFFILGKNRLYPSYSVNSYEIDDSPVHNTIKTSTAPNTKGLYNLPYTPSHQYTLTYKPTGSGFSDTPTSSDNASDATLTDTELPLARDNTLLVNNGESFRIKKMISFSWQFKW